MPRKKKIVEKLRVDGSSLVKVMKDEYGDQTFSVNWHGVDVTVRKTITLAEMLGMVRDIVTSCYDEDQKYLPEVFDFAAAVSLLSRYANIDMPGDIEEQYALVVGTDLYSMIAGEVNQRQLDQILEAARAHIEYINCEHSNFVMSRISELSESLEAVAGRVKDVFDGVNAEDLQNVIKAVGENGIDMDKVVQTYIDKSKNVTSAGVL